MSSESPRGRLAPSPTGALHLGNARSFLLAWLDIRSRGGRVILRMEDLDGPRVKAGAAEQACQDLAWLGLDWDEGPLVQSGRLPLHEEALARLTEKKLAYPCVCTRREVEEAASAPHESGHDAGPLYPGTCRGRFAGAEAARRESGRDPAWRLRVEPAAAVSVRDRFLGERTFRAGRELDDFVVWKKSGTPAYQLACVVDDHRMGVTDVLRGEDLLLSTARQLLLYRAWGWEPPAFAHTPLLVGRDGRRLAKRHGDTRVARFRHAGIAPAPLVGWLAAISGLLPPGKEALPADLVADFALHRVPPGPVTVELPLPFAPGVSG